MNWHKRNSAAWPTITIFRTGFLHGTHNPSILYWNWKIGVHTDHLNEGATYFRLSFLYVEIHKILYQRVGRYARTLFIYKKERFLCLFLLEESWIHIWSNWCFSSIEVRCRTKRLDTDIQFQYREQIFKYRVTQKWKFKLGRC